MKIEVFEGLLESNTYVAYDNSNEGIIIDASADLKSICDFVKDKKINIKHIVLTHGHCDHVHFINDYKQVFDDASIICHKKELMVLKNPEANVSSFILGRDYTYDCDYALVDEGDTICFGNTKLFVLNMPGHTPGSICLFCMDEEIMFTGDVIFASSYGRTDFLYGSMNDMMESLRRIRRFGGSIRIYPGHYESAQLKDIFGI